MIKIRKLFKDKHGFSAPWAVVIALVILLIMTAVFQYVRLMIIASGVKDAVQSAVISVANDNYGNVYTGVREGYSGGYGLNGSSWKECLSDGNVYGRLDELLGLNENGSKHTKSNAEGEEFSVYGLSVNVINAPFAPSATGKIQQFEADAEITLEVPLSFCGDILSPMKVNLNVKSKYTPKF